MVVLQMQNKLCLLLPRLKMTLIGWRARNGSRDEAAGISLKTFIQEAALCEQACVTDSAKEILLRTRLSGNCTTPVDLHCFKQQHK